MWGMLKRTGRYIVFCIMAHVSRLSTVDRIVYHSESREHQRPLMTDDLKRVIRVAGPATLAGQPKHRPLVQQCIATSRRCTCTLCMFAVCSVLTSLSASHPHPSFHKPRSDSDHSLGPNNPIAASSMTVPAC